MLSFSIIKNPAYFDDWLAYHTGMGLHMLLYLDGPLSVKNHEIVQKYSEKVQCFDCKWPPGSHYTEKHYYASRDAINQCYDKKERYLIHFDDDELFYFKVKSLKVFEEFLDQSPLRTFVLTNYEAVKTRESYAEGSSFFKEETWFERSARIAYWQGKPIARIDDGIVHLESPHRFRDPRESSDSDFLVPTKYALILHYPMMEFDAWQRKETIHLENQRMFFGLYLKTIAFLQEKRTHEEKMEFYLTHRMRSTYFIDRDPTTVSISAISDFFKV